MEKEFERSISYPIAVRTVTGQNHILNVKPTDTIWNVKQLLEEVEGIPAPQIRLLFKAHTLSNESTLSAQHIGKDDILYLILATRGDGPSFRCDPNFSSHSPKIQTYEKSYARVSIELDPNRVNLIDLIKCQSVDGYWKIKSSSQVFSNLDQTKINEFNQKIDQLMLKDEFEKIKNDSVVKSQVKSTLLVLILMKKFMMPFYEMWKLIYQKAINWLQKLNKSVQWEEILNSL